MKELPEITPELRGLLEEIVADPRSSIRFAPRRALRSWFDGDEVLRARDVEGTRAERHLVEAHREALAELLCEAARIAYWKGPVLSVRPNDDKNRPYDVAARERLWSERADQKVRHSDSEAGLGLLRQALRGIEPADGAALARASLSLAPSNDARLTLGCHAMGQRPRWALSLFRRVAHGEPSPRLRALAWAQVANRLAWLGQLQGARLAYEESLKDWPYAALALFNLACIEGAENEARAYSAAMDTLFDDGCRAVGEASEQIRHWLRSRSTQEVRTARGTVARIGDGLSAPARKVALAYA